mmetsp:Transcript_60142/g.135992  ORF Transcript_60142/g.135992 Transcript_60142/m.135992 type:complete len:141 (-) Transcript_60142:204-626(-)
MAPRPRRWMRSLSSTSSFSTLGLVRPRRLHDSRRSPTSIAKKNVVAMESPDTSARKRKRDVIKAILRKLFFLKTSSESGALSADAEGSLGPIRKRDKVKNVFRKLFPKFKAKYKGPTAPPQIKPDTQGPTEARELKGRAV